MQVKKSRYISLQEVADYLEVSKQSVHKWINNNDIPANRLPSGMIKILKSDFLSYLERQGLYVDRKFFNMTTLRIVVINNDIKIQNIIKGIFKNLSVLKLVNGGFDFNVEYSHDGISGLLKIGELNPDLVLLDMEQPGMNGLDICKNINGGPKHNHAEIIVFTDSVAKYKSALQELGVQHIFAKPLRKKYLMETIGSILRRHVN